MESHTAGVYKTLMSVTAVTRGRAGASGIFPLALLFACFSSCGDDRDRDNHGADAGSGGRSAPAATSTGEMAGDGGTGGDETGSDDPTPSPDALCASDDECSDGVWCNGRERCRSKFPGADAKVCMKPERGPCSPNVCNEAARECDCSDEDADHDGFPSEGCANGREYDCDDDDGNRFPGNPEVCLPTDPEHDEDCRDDTYAGAEADRDEDDFFDSACANASFYQPLVPAATGVSMNRGNDCRDDRKNIHPDAEEKCNGEDDDCDGVVDEVFGTPEKPHTYYRDIDGDQWGNSDEPLETLCNVPPSGFALLHGDCNDQDPKVEPGRPEVCNGHDDDCDGIVDRPERADALLIDDPYDGVTRFECTGESGWKVSACPSGRIDCDQSFLNACETPSTTLCNCHACGNSCRFSCGEGGCEEISALSAGHTHSCAVVDPSGPAGGTVACWGKNTRGQLGDGTTRSSPVVVPVPVRDLSGVTAVTSGAMHSCAIADGVLYCWGSNEYGQLGGAPLELFSSYRSPVASRPELGKAVQVASGRFHTCAVYEYHAIACWGRGDEGQLGNGAAISERTTIPSQVRRETMQFIDDAVQVVAGRAHTCVLSRSGVECWGDNELGQLGEDPAVLTGSTTAHRVPGLDGIAVDELAAASAHTCARASSDVYCWGSNLSRESGGGGIWGPVTRIPLPEAIVGIAAGTSFSCALGAGGTLYCWGSNESGQLGSASPAPSAPRPVPLEGVRRVFGGDGQHACAITATGAWCWGRNDVGQLGTGDVAGTAQPVPRPVHPLSGSQACVVAD